MSNQGPIDRSASLRVIGNVKAGHLVELHHPPGLSRLRRSFLFNPILDLESNELRLLLSIDLLVWFTLKRGEDAL
jgi:hypothetical protein